MFGRKKFEVNMLEFSGALEGLLYNSWSFASNNVFGKGVNDYSALAEPEKKQAFLEKFNERFGYGEELLNHIIVDGGCVPDVIVTKLKILEESIMTDYFNRRDSKVTYKEYVRSVVKDILVKTKNLVKEETDWQNSLRRC